MREVFVDSAFYIALLNRKDGLHQAACAAETALGKVKHVTSEMVLVEVLSYFSANASLRSVAAQLVKNLQSKNNTEIIPQSSDLFRRAVNRYAERADKEWSLVDCASMLIMEERNLTEALTADHHFEQAGFKALITVTHP